MKSHTVVIFELSWHLFFLLSISILITKYVQFSPEAIKVRLRTMKATGLLTVAEVVFRRRVASAILKMSFTGRSQVECRGSFTTKVQRIYDPAIKRVAKMSLVGYTVSTVSPRVSYRN